MPYVSTAQRGWAHTPAGEKALGGPAKVAEWDRASKGKTNLPGHVPAHAQGGTVMAKSGGLKDAEFAKGGASLGRSGDWKKSIPNRGFLDTKNRFVGEKLPKPEPTEDNFGKGSSKANPTPADKSEKPIKPRS